MDNKIDNKIRGILDELDKAQKEVEKVCGYRRGSSGDFDPTDIYELGRAFAYLHKTYIELKLARAEKFPDRLPMERIEEMNIEKLRLEREIRAYTNRQLPSRYRG